MYILSLSMSVEQCESSGLFCSS